MTQQRKNRCIKAPKQKASEAAATASKAQIVARHKQTRPSTPKPPANANEEFSIGLIWEAEHRGELIRFYVSDHPSGNRYADLRRFYRAGDEWRHGRQGCPVPLWGLSELHSALGRYLAGETPGEPAKAA